MVWEMISPSPFNRKHSIGGSEANFMTSYTGKMRAGNPLRSILQTLETLKLFISQVTHFCQFFSSFNLKDPFSLPSPMVLAGSLIKIEGHKKGQDLFPYFVPNCSFWVVRKCCDLKCPSVSLELLAFSQFLIVCANVGRIEDNFSFLEFCTWKLPHIEA